MTLAFRLRLAFGLMVLVTAVMGGLTLFKISAMQTSLYDVTEHRMVILEELSKLRDQNHVQAGMLRNMAIVSKPEVAQTYVERVQDSRKQVRETMARLDTLITNEKGRAVLSNMVAKGEKYSAVVDGFMALITDNRKSEVESFLMDQIRPAQTDYFSAIVEESKVQEEMTASAVDQAESAVQAIKATVWVTGGLALAASLFLAIRITRTITQPIQQAVAVARAVSAGDLSQRIDPHGDDETAQLLRALSDMQTSLIQVVGTVRSGSEAVATASAQIARGNHDLSSRTENQASALEETSASMEQLGSTVRQNSDNARQANQLAQSASSVATQGGQVVSQVVDTMRGISDSSKRIADIITVIDGIAFQTNILALNAAVEAARAGEQGRGFAVVASEVRSLAQRSAEAAREIKQLITDSVQRVDQGSTLVDQAGATMNEVVVSIRRVTDIMGEISAASIEQSQGVAQVGEAIMQMDQSTQQNAAMVEEMSAAASGLNTQAQDLVKAVAAFKLDQREARPFAEKVEPVSRLAVRSNPPSATAAPVERRGTGKPHKAPSAARTAPAPQPAAAPVTPASHSDEDWETF